MPWKTKTNIVLVHLSVFNNFSTLSVAISPWHIDINVYLVL